MPDTLSPDAARALDGPSGRPIPSNPDVLLFTAEAAYLLSIKERTLEALRLRGGGPPFVRVTSKSVRYRRQDIDAWILARERRSTSDPGAEGGR